MMQNNPRTKPKIIEAVIPL